MHGLKAGFSWDGDEVLVSAVGEQRARAVA